MATFVHSDMCVLLHRAMIFAFFEQPAISGSEGKAGGIKLWLYNPHQRAAGEHLTASFSNSAKTVSQFNITLNFKVYINLLFTLI